MTPETPCFRQDLVATTTEVDGIGYVDVQDPRTGTTFRFYDFEHAVAQKLDGRNVSEVASWVQETYGIESTAEGIAEFARQLGELGFIEGYDAKPVSPHDVFGASPVSEEDAPAPGPAAKPAAAPPSPVYQPPAPLPELPNEAFLADAVAAPTVPRPAETAVPEHQLAEAEPKQHFDDEPTVASANAVPDFAAESTVATAADGLRDVEPASVTMTLEAEPPSTDALAELPANAYAMDAAAAAPAALTAPEPVQAAGWESPGPAAVEEAAAAAPAALTAPEPVQAAGWESPGPTEHRPAAADVAMTSSDDQLDDFEVPRHRRMWLLVPLSALVAAGLTLWLRSPRGPEPVGARVVTPSPTAVYRWFDGTGTVKTPAPRSLAFIGSGTVIDVLPAGAAFRAGDVVAKLEGANPLQASLQGYKERLAYYVQMVETMTAAGNRAAVHQAELKIGEKRRLIEEAKAALDKLAVVADEPGTVAEPLVRRGAIVSPGTPAVRIKSKGELRIELGLSSADAEQARHLGFCRVEIEGTTADCKLVDAPDGKLEAELPAGTDTAPGKTARLARARFEAVFPVPTSAIVRVGDTDRLYVVGPQSRAEIRAITVADRGADESLVSQGIDVGDRVIAEIPPGLANGNPVQPR